MKTNKFANKKFVFNPETLEYESIGRNIKLKLKRTVSFLLFSFIIAAVYYAVYSLFFDTPSEYSVKRENKILKEHLDELGDRYQHLDEVISDISRRDSNIYSVIFESKPLDGFSSETSLASAYKALQSKTNMEILQSANEKFSQLSLKVQKQSEYFDSLKNLVAAKREELEYIPAIIPIVGLHVNSIGASVGDKIHPIYKVFHVHTGIDFAASVGTPVVATASGKVKHVITKKFSTGTEITIDHGNDYETRYMYLNKSLVKEGARIKCGDKIGEVGNIGLSVPHLHYEVRMGGKIADPLNYFFKELSPKETIVYALMSLDKGQSLD
ncbi:MAG: M23 family metallopeptidase [Prevotellaceae bacterium]|jgi:murein DD-endopeptidase MepM/ murein hydrolase activator NlpD|nr:M23 family metallopeptidase [Prevotellaceae bacterium]